MFYFIGISIAFFLALLLVAKQRPTTGDRLLAIWLCVIGSHLAFYSLQVTGLLYQYPHLLGFQLPLPLLHGPFLYLYTAAMTQQLPQRKPLALLHFLPAAAAYLWMVPFCLRPAAEKIDVFVHNGAGYEGFQNLLVIGFLVSGVAYVVWAALVLRKHRQRIQHLFSNTEKVDLAWLRYLIGGIAIIWCFVIAGNDPMIFTTTVLFVVFMGFFGIRQTRIFATAQPTAPVHSAAGVAADYIPEQKSTTPVALEQPPTAPETDPAEGHNERRKYEKSGLSEAAANSLHQRLCQLMATENCYTESELSLSELATKLGVHSNYLSQVINDKEGQNFYDYINRLRIDAFKRLAAAPKYQHYTLLALAFECGFNSKSTFNRCFKKATGVSPSDYLRQQETQAAPTLLPATC